MLMKKYHQLTLTIVSALLGVLSFPPLGWWGLILVAWTPFFAAVRELPPRSAFLHGLLHGIITFGISLSWLWHLFSAGAIALWGLLAIFPAVWAWSYVRLQRGGTIFVPILAAILFTGFEYFRGEIFILSFPWITPGTGLPPNLLTPLIGTYGVSFFVILSSLLLLEPGKKTELSGLVIALVILTAICMNPGYKRLDQDENNLKVALIQDDPKNAEAHLERSSVFPGYADIILWPEYALENDPQKDPELEDAMVELLQQRAQLLVAGGPIWHDAATLDFSNTAFTYDRDGLLATHTKNRTTHLLNDGRPGKTANAIDTPVGRIGTPICFDCDHQDVVRRMVTDGAKLFLVPAMNLKEWSRKEHLQHAVHVRHRAAEHCRWFAVASTSGVTQIVDPYGNVTQQLPLMKAASLTGRVHLESEITIFQRGGWLLGPCLSILAGGILGVLIWQWFRERAINQIDSNITDFDSQSHPASALED